MDIRYSEIADEPYLKKWLLEKESQKWFPVSDESEVNSMCRNWIGFSKFRASLTATMEGIPCGIGTLFLMPYQKVAHHTMFHLIVDPEKRKQGVGSSLMKNLINLSKNYFRHELMYAEIYEGCLLAPILDTLGFEKIATQEGFVKEDDHFLNKVFYQHLFQRESNEPN